MAPENVSATEVIRNELDLVYRRPLLFRAVVSSGINYQKIPYPLRNAYGRLISRKKLLSPRRSFPIDTRGMERDVSSPWRGSFALCLTHDVDTKYGMEHGIEILSGVERLNDMESTWCVVPMSRHYVVDPDRLKALVSEGHEIAVHGLYHDGRFAFVGPAERERRVAAALYTLRGMGLSPNGFRAPLLHRTRDLIDLLEKHGYLWDSSYPDSDPTTLGYEGTGCATVFPFHPLVWIGSGFAHSKVVELPITLSQDWTLIHSLGYSDRDALAVWKKKIDFIASVGGMALVITHPDRYDLGNRKRARIYEELLRYARLKNAIIGTCNEMAKSWLSHESHGRKE